MRKKQFLAFLLTGVLAVGMAPTAAFAAEEASALSIEGEAEAAPAAEEGSTEGEETTPPAEEVPVETPPAEAPTEAPTEAPAEPTETPTETPTEAPTAAPENPEENPEGTAQLQNNESTPTPSPEAKAAGEGAIMIGTQGYATLAEAITAAPSATAQEEPIKIVIQGDLEIDATVSVPADKNILLVAASENTTINRKEGFTGAMFKVEGGTLQLGAGIAASEDGSAAVAGSLTVDGSLEAGTPVDGAIVEVASGTFGLLDGVTMTGNFNNGNGGAVNNTAGNVFLLGGSITGNNAAEGGAVYSETAVFVQGTVSVTGNKKADGVTESNIVLKGAPVTVTNALTGSQIGVTVLEGAADQAVVTIQEGVADVALADVVAQFTYDGEDFTIGEDGKLKSTAVTTPTPTPTPAEALKLTGKSMEWTSYNSAKITCVANKDGWYYVDWVTRGSKAPTFDLEKEGVPVQADREFVIYLADLDSENAIDVYVRVKDKDNNISKKMLFKLDEEKRPPVPTQAPSRDPIVPKVTESVVQGLENPLEFHRNTFYEFTVIGAGTQNNDPIQGDVKWVPLYWSTSSNPSESQKHTTWKIGAANGIAQAATYNLYVFFQKYEYDGANWQATNTVESATYQFRSKAITLATVTPTPTMAGQSGGYNGGDGSDSSDPQSQTADGDVTGATSTDPVSTADESPIGTMMMLAAVSLLAGGYVLVRRRKKEF